MKTYNKKSYGKGSSYTRQHYKYRGAGRIRDKIFEQLRAGKCEMCGNYLERKIGLGGKLENLKKFLKRKTCGKYRDENGVLLDTDCLKRWRAIPQNNGRYLGIMHIPCEICGKVGLSYKNSGYEYHRCIDCYQKYRPPAYNKKNDLVVHVCATCGKSVPNRWASGRLRYTKNKDGKFFCSTSCVFKKEKIFKKCLFCAKDMFLSPCYAKRNFCSMQCATRHRYPK